MVADVKRMPEERKNGHQTQTPDHRLFAGSVAWAGPLALILIGLLIAVSVLIEYFKDNKIHEWLKRCWWGNGPDAQYPDVETEMKQLELAVA